MNLRATVLAIFTVAGALSASGLRGVAQTIPTTDNPQLPRFEVVSVKRNVSGSGNMRVELPRNGRFVGENVTAANLVLTAYPYDRFRAFGLPGWADSERYDVAAVGSPGGTLDELRGRVRALLIDRFHLAAHIETRIARTYRLVRRSRDGSLGPRLRPWTTDCKAAGRSDQPSQSPIVPLANWAVPPPCGTRGGRGVYAAGGVPISSLVLTLSNELNAVVTDATDLTGVYEISLQWNPEPGAAGVDSSLPTLETALQEQLGLKLEPARAPVDVLVVDHIERPEPD